MPSTKRSTSTTTTLIAKIPYLNSVPFYFDLPIVQEFQIRECVPRQLAQAAADGEKIAGPLPVAAFLRLGNDFERLGHFGIAVRGRAHSAMLFSRKPLRQLEGCTFALTGESATTVCLLRLILEQRYELSGLVYKRERDPQADALLLIGDEALRFRQDNKLYPFETDLAFEWWLWQHLPFVFAVWAIRKDTPEPENKRIEAGIARALALNSGRLGVLAQQYAASVNMKPEDVEAYLGAFVYRLSALEEEGLQQFKKLLEQHHLLEWSSG